MFRFRLHFLNQRLDLFSGIVGMGRQAPYLFCHNPEASAVFSRPGSLDSRVERQQVRLSCDIGHQVDDLADLL
ncbi:hypothetical protein D3C81_2239320 [compost metagenome]